MATTKFPFWLKCLHYNRGGAVVTCPLSTGRGWLQPRLAKSNFPGEWSWLWLDGGWKGLSRLYLRILRAAAPGLQKTLWAADTGNLVFLSVSVSAQSSLFTNLPSISSTILIKYLNTTWYPHQWQPGTPRHSYTHFRLHLGSGAWHRAYSASLSCLMSTSSHFKTVEVLDIIPQKWKRLRV